MASIFTTCCTGAQTAPKVAALTLFGTVALLVDLPELSLLGGLLVYAWASNKKAAAPEWCSALTDSVVFRSLRSKTPALFLGAVLAVVLTDVLVPFLIALLSSVFYVALYEYGKPKRSASLKLSRSDAEKPVMANAPANSQWRRHAQVTPATVDTCGLPKVAARVKVQTPGGSEAKINGSCGAEVAGVARTGFDAEVEELVRNSMPTKGDDAVVRQLVKLARKSLLPVVPEAEIRAFASGNLAYIGDSGSKPEVDMIVTLESSVLADRLKSYFLRGQTRVQKSLETLHPDVLRKTATKCLSERLTFVRFWRSQFTGPEPLIVLLVPVDMGLFNHPIRLNFMVNSPYPLRFATVLSKESMRSKDLVFLVARWSRERCIANMSRGFPHQYAWALLAIYFLRNRSTSEEVGGTTAELFKEFVEFYASVFDRQDDHVSICFSKQVVPPSAKDALPGVTYIEDPFDAKKHAGACVTAGGVLRIKEELARAHAVFERDDEPKLAELIERWTPPSQEAL